MSTSKLDITERNLCMTLPEGNRYLLLETDLISKPSIRVSEIDPFTTREWLWGDTFLDEHQEDGPLLVKFDDDSKLLTEYLESWAKINAAILMVSPYAMDDVLRHLQSIILIMKPGGNQSRLRLHEPRKLAGLLGTLNAQTQSSLMGPIEHIIWLENCGQDQTWYQATNTTPRASRNNKNRWFHFNTAQMQAFDQFEEQWFIRNLAWQVAEQYDLNITIAQEETKRLCQGALDNGFTAEQDITDYCHLHMQHPGITDNKHCSILLKEQSIQPHARLVKINRLLRQQ